MRTGIHSTDHRYDEMLARITVRSAERDARRVLPYDDIAALAEAGFGALRVPEENDGSGLSVIDTTEYQLALATADSNHLQALRSHFLFTDALLLAPASAQRSLWLNRIGAGAILGGAATERSATTTDRFSTSISRDAHGHRVVHGTKYYSTGTLYADWFVAVAESDQEGVTHVVIPADAEGVRRKDDWDGFGQRLSASGTTVLDHVVIDDDATFPSEIRIGSYTSSLAQHLLLVALAGISRAAHAAVTDYVRERRRYFPQGPRVLPRHDPIVQETVGRLSAAAYLSETLVRETAAELQELAEATAAGAADAALEDRVEVQVYRAQHLIAETVLDATSRLFDVGGASALSADRNWDRYWRNARTLASHNPIGYRLTSIADHELNGASPFRRWFSGVDLHERLQ